jgi:nucleoside-diphosphate-sugar epimerase
MKIGITGAKGFLGKILTGHLAKDHQLISIGRSADNDISIDLAKEIPDLPELDILIHSAGKAHVIPKTEEEVRDFFSVNVQGTSNLIKGIKTPPQLVVFISSVAVYGLEEGEEIDETAPLSGGSPYADSKIQAEQLLVSWGKEERVPVVILRLPLIAGPNPPGNLGAMIRAIRSGYYFRLGKGEARKSMVWALDIARLIPNLAGKSGVFNLTDGHHPKLSELDRAIADLHGKRIISMSENILAPLAKIGDLVPFFPLNSYRLTKLSKTLTFSDTKARKELEWNPSQILNELKSGL